MWNSHDTCIGTVTGTATLRGTREALAEAGRDGAGNLAQDVSAEDRGPRRLGAMIRDPRLTVPLFQPCRDIGRLPGLPVIAQNQGSWLPVTASAMVLIFKVKAVAAFGRYVGIRYTSCNDPAPRLSAARGRGQAARSSGVIASRSPAPSRTWVSRPVTSGSSRLM